MEINSFSNIKIKQNTLIICDIDETLLYIKKSNICLSILCSYWFTDAHFTDKNGFKKLLEEIENTNSTLCFLTARENTKKIKNFTKMDFDDFQIYFCGKIPKGEFILKNINHTFFNEIIFIDDLDQNIENVKNIFGSKIKCYKFI
jgi:hypothetical protein